jgi:hypothetical protein
LEGKYYKLIADFDERFKITPSLIKATSFQVDGDWLFDQPSAIVGAVHLTDQGQQTRFV